MNINKYYEGTRLTVVLSGRLDTVTAPELDAELADLERVNELVIDMKELDYVSSAGLRVLLSAHKRMMRAGRMVIINVNELIGEVFEVTGFNEVFNIE